VTYLWAANAVATEVTPETLEQLQKAGSVSHILLDREIQVLSTEELDEGDEIPGMTVENARSYGIFRIRAGQARKAFGVTGKGIRVGILDTGIAAEHPALAGRLLAFRDFVKKKSRAYDDAGHGSHCAGTIAGPPGIGVAPDAQLIVAKALNHQGGGTVSGFLAAMQWMLDPDGDPLTEDQPHLVSNSWGAAAEAMGESQELFREVVKAWRQAGIVPVFAAGNFGPEVAVIPAGYPESFAVGATDEEDEVGDFSSGGESDFDGELLVKPDVTAPGVTIISVRNQGGFSFHDGTSMACPHVAGALALALEAFPDASVEDLEEAFSATSLDLGPPGRDSSYGEGRIDVMAALEALGRR
jgi:bacillopeptidase F